MHLPSPAGGGHLKLTVSRKIFEDICKDLFEKCMDQIDQLLSGPDGPSGDWPPPLKVLPPHQCLLGLLPFITKYSAAAKRTQVPLYRRVP